MKMDPNVSYEEAFLKTHMPYCIQSTREASYVVLNREYKPLGGKSREWYDYLAYDLMLPITEEDARAMSHEGSPSLKSIHLYKDSFRLLEGEKPMRDYLKRLAVLARLHPIQKSDYYADHSHLAEVELAGLAYYRRVVELAKLCLSPKEVSDAEWVLKSVENNPERLREREEDRLGTRIYCEPYCNHRSFWHHELEIVRKGAPPKIGRLQSTVSE
jgi:hypothetical protein